MVTGESSTKDFKSPSLPIFDVNKIKGVDHPTMLFLGKRRTGKTYKMRDILYHLKDDYPMGIVITETRFNGFWQKYMPPAYIWDDYDADRLRAVLERQKKLKHMKMTGKLPRSYNMKIFIVFDDVMGLNEDVLRYDPVFRTIFVEGRHFEITLLIALQDAFGMPPKDRNNIDFCFVMKQQQERNFEAIRENYLSWLKPKELANQLIRDNTRVEVSKTEVDEDGKPKIIAKWSVVIDWATDYDTERETLFKYNGEDPGKFKLCCKQMWNNSKDWSYDPGKLSKEELLFVPFKAESGAPSGAASGGKSESGAAATQEEDTFTTELQAITKLLPHYN